MGILSAFSPINNTEKKNEEIIIDTENATIENSESDKWDKENLAGSPMIVSSLPSSAQRNVFGSSTAKIPKSNNPPFSNRLKGSALPESRETPQSKVSNSASVTKKRATRSSTKTLSKLVQAAPLSDNGPFVVELKPSQDETDNAIQDVQQPSTNFADLDGLSGLIRTIVRDEIDDLKLLTLRDIRNLHIDMLKGNTLLERSVERALARHLPTIGELLKELEHLRNENKRLKLRFGN
jgi:hypothetical protein